MSHQTQGELDADEHDDDEKQQVEGTFDHDGTSTGAGRAEGEAVASPIPSGGYHIGDMFRKGECVTPPSPGPASTGTPAGGTGRTSCAPPMGR
jgi:hypothetical protein